VVDAVREGRFHLWAVNDIDEAMELLTGMTAGQPDAKGEVPEGTINFHIALQLAELAQMRQDIVHPKPAARRHAAKKPAKAPPRG
jgi:hypothetical protein